MTDRREPKWFTRWLAQQHIEEEDAYCDGLTPSEEMLVNAFITDAQKHFLADLFNAKAPFTEIRRFEDELRGAIETAYAVGEPWLRLDAPPWLLPDAPPIHCLRSDAPPPGGPLLGWLKLDPRAAARWLLSKPTYQHLVPPPWARVVLRDAKAKHEETTGGKPARPRGPQPETSERVIRDMQKMEELTPGRLGKMLGKEMVAEFRASRTMCRQLRKRVLSEAPNGGVSNSAKI